MIAFASVDLPEPFGPIRAWISPFSTARSTPRRMSFSPARTCRLRISSCGIGLPVGCSGSAGLDDRRRRDGRLRVRGARTARELDELGERGALERADDADLHAQPE